MSARRMNTNRERAAAKKVFKTVGRCWRCNECFQFLEMGNDVIPISCNYVVMYNVIPYHINNVRS